ncbi:MAG: hypothetical protein EOS23_31610 [Mesorhizobium sp.]|nr:MAG: hypothetical protein EOS23_31610 [Mesorhizobium sp.]
MRRRVVWAKKPTQNWPNDSRLSSPVIHAILDSSFCRYCADGIVNAFKLLLEALKIVGKGPIRDIYGDGSFH